MYGLNTQKKKTFYAGVKCSKPPEIPNSLLLDDRRKEQKKREDIKTYKGPHKDVTGLSRTKEGINGGDTGVMKSRLRTMD